jgi:hypothetical protein
MHQIHDEGRGEARRASSRTDAPARLQPSRVERVRDVRVDVIVEQAIDEIDDGRLRFDLLRGRRGVVGFERLGFAAPESEVDAGGPGGGDLDERRIVDDRGEHPLPVTVRGGGVCPQASEVRRHGDQPLPRAAVDPLGVIVAGAFALRPRGRERAQFVVPLGFERIGDQAVVGIHQHVPALREIGVLLRAFDRARS